MNSLIKQFLYILALSILCGFIRYFTLTDYYLIDSNIQTPLIVASNDFTQGPRPTNIKYAKELYDKGLGCFIDARDIDEFNEAALD